MIKVDIRCNMTFQNFPFDTQRCEFLMKSLSEEKKMFLGQASLNWDQNQLTTPEFIGWIEKFNKPNVAIKKNRVSVSGFYFMMRRKPVLYIYLYFVPCTLMVLTSWISFAINYEIVPGRLGLLVTLLLMMINLCGSVAASIPKSNHICPLLCWIIMSVAFVTFALLEYFVILVRVKFRAGRQVSSDQKQGRNGKKNTVDKWALKLDKTALTVIPFLYFIFVVYFLVQNY